MCVCVCHQKVNTNGTSHKFGWRGTSESIHISAAKGHLSSGLFVQNLAQTLVVPVLQRQFCDLRHGSYPVQPFSIKTKRKWCFHTV